MNSSEVGTFTGVVSRSRREVEASTPMLGCLQSVACRHSNWHSINESNFAWERDALDFIRERFPDREPYRAWSNFEFIADDGSVNQVTAIKDRKCPRLAEPPAAPSTD